MILEWITVKDSKPRGSHLSAMPSYKIYEDDGYRSKKFRCVLVYMPQENKHDTNIQKKSGESMRIAKVKVTNVLLLELLKGFKSGFRGRYKVVEHGLPGDAVLAGVEVDGDVINMLIKSEEFADVADSADIPILESPVFESVKETGCIYS